MGTTVPGGGGGERWEGVFGSTGPLRAERYAGVGMGVR